MMSETIEGGPIVQQGWLQYMSLQHAQDARQSQQGTGDGNRDGSRVGHVHANQSAEVLTHPCQTGERNGTIFNGTLS